LTHTARAPRPRGRRRRRGSRGDTRLLVIGFLNQWARGRQGRIPFVSAIGLAARIGSLLLYKAAFVDNGPIGLVAADLVLFLGGGLLTSWATITWQSERQKVYRRRAEAARKRGGGTRNTPSK